MKKFIIAIIACLLPIPAFGWSGPFYAEPGWWDIKSDATTDHTAAAWTYPDYPINCNGVSSADAFQFLWIMPDTATTNLYEQHKGSIRESIRRASSIFAASTKRTFATESAKLHDFTPRLVTFENASGTCHPWIPEVVVPASVLTVEPSAPGGLNAWLGSHGYNRTDRKYYSLIQRKSPNQFVGASTINDTIDTSPGVSNANNQGPTYMYEFKNPAGNYDSAFTVAQNGADFAHEIAHSLGSVLPGSPHYNVLNPVHPTDCYDLLCYSDELNSYPGENRGVCTAKKMQVRLDCNKDDYFNDDGAAWTAQRWAISTSTFLWK